MKKCLIALVQQRDGGPRIRHYQSSPAQLAGREMHKALPRRERVLLMEEDPDGVSLYHFTPDGEVVSHTWHTNINDAKRQSALQYGEALGKWREIRLDRGRSYR